MTSKLFLTLNNKSLCENDNPEIFDMKIKKKQKDSIKNIFYICNKCNYKTERKYDYNNHLKTKKHSLFSSNTFPQNSDKSIFGSGDASTKNVNYKKFKEPLKQNVKEPNTSVECENVNLRYSPERNVCENYSCENEVEEKTCYTCCCKKTYKGKNGRKMLYKHKNICEIYKKLRGFSVQNVYDNKNLIVEDLERIRNSQETSIENKNIFSERNIEKIETPLKNTYEEYIKTVQTQNELLNKIIINQEERINETKQETLLIQNQLLEYMKTNKNQVNNVTNNNKTININIFLNEKCKDALSIEEFVNTLNITVDKVEEYANAGYVNWVTDVLIDGFRNTDIKKRPIHCSDLKREVLYIRNENKWEKDLEYKYFDKFLGKISSRYSSLFNEWCNITPLNYISGTSEYETGFKVMCNTYSDDKKQKKILNTVKDKIYLHRKQLKEWFSEDDDDENFNLGIPRS